MAAVVAWRIVVVTMADRNVAASPTQALYWQSAQPDALLALARQQLQSGETAAAGASARSLLVHAPLQGQAFAVLAQIAEHDGDQDRALAMYRIASRRSPRDPYAQAWLADRALKAGDNAAALRFIDVMYRVSPQVREALVSAMVRNASNQAFASALVDVLKHRPVWRDSVLAALQAGSDQVLASRILGALQRQGGLTVVEMRSWLSQLVRQGLWGQAYARWVGTLDLRGAPLPALYNGGFDVAPDGQAVGFDWMLQRIPGVLLDFAPVQGTRGLAAHVMFLGRPVAQASLEHPLLLAPGDYKLTLRMRADALRSNNGLEWAVFCRTQAQSFARSEPIDGSFPWRTLSMDITVPGKDCDGQWLRLMNPAPSGSASQVSGALWFDDAAIIPRQGAGPGDHE